MKTQQKKGTKFDTFNSHLPKMERISIAWFKLTFAYLVTVFKWKFDPFLWLENLGKYLWQHLCSSLGTLFCFTWILNEGGNGTSKGDEQKKSVIHLGLLRLGPAKLEPRCPLKEGGKTSHKVEWNHAHWKMTAFCSV